MATTAIPRCRSNHLGPRQLRHAFGTDTFAASRYHRSAYLGLGCLRPIRIAFFSSADLAFDERNRVPDRDETLRVAVVNTDVEFLLKRHDELIEVDAVSTKVGELGVFGHPRFYGTEVKRDDFSYPFSDIGHRSPPRLLLEVDTPLPAGARTGAVTSDNHRSARRHQDLSVGIAPSLPQFIRRRDAPAEKGDQGSGPVFASQPV